MRILSIDTSCDETAAAVTDGLKIISNVVWSQASLHAKFGGVHPSLAQREHEKRIDFVIENALKKAFPKPPYTIYDILSTKVDGIAVTTGPGLAIALGVGINKAKELAKKYNKSLIPVNHVEAHLLSALAQATKKQKNKKTTFDYLKIKQNNYQEMFPAIGIVASGGTSQVILINNIGDCLILATTIDDALGEALDKGARALGFGYPGGAVLEKIAREGTVNTSVFPVPMLGRENLLRFSYSGLKTALVRKIAELEKTGQLKKSVIQDIAASYQETAFNHFIRITERAIKQTTVNNKLKTVLVGGGVGANVMFRKKLHELAKRNNLNILFPYSKKLYTDNAGMVGVAAYLKLENLKTEKQKGGFSVFSIKHLDKIDRRPDWRI